MVTKMPRQARKISPTGYYHIMLRSNNKEKIFKKEAQKGILIKSLKVIAAEQEVSFVAYCFMDNHIHLVLKGDLDDISITLRRVNIKYAMNFNKKNDRVGHVFQDRYKSEIIIDDKYLLQVVRYVHNNPVKAKMVASPDLYKWSSYNEYARKRFDVINPKEGHFIMGYFSGKQSQFLNFHNEMDFEVYLDTKEDIKARKLDISKMLIDDYCSTHGIGDSEKFKESPKHQEGLVKVLLEKSQMSHRQIADILGINSNMVHQVSIKLKS